MCYPLQLCTQKALAIYIKLACSIKARTFFGSCPRQIPMPYNLRLGKHDLQLKKQVPDGMILLGSQCVMRATVLIQPSLIANPDAASIIRSGMRPHLQQLTVL